MQKRGGGVDEEELKRIEFRWRAEVQRRYRQTTSRVGLGLILMRFTCLDLAISLVPTGGTSSAPLGPSLSLSPPHVFWLRLLPLPVSLDFGPCPAHEARGSHRFFLILFPRGGMFALDVGFVDSFDWRGVSLGNCWMSLWSFLSHAHMAGLVHFNCGGDLGFHGGAFRIRPITHFLSDFST